MADRDAVGTVISLTDRIAERAQERAVVAPGRASFFFAIDCPVSYLVAERVERELGDIAWVPTLLAPTTPGRALERMRRARIDAAGRRLTILEPENFPFDPRPAARAAVYASSCGHGARFGLAAMRMAFAGGFDLSDPDVIAEAAAAADMNVDDVLTASTDPAHDDTLEATVRTLARNGILEPPMTRVNGAWFSGFEAFSQGVGFAPVTTAYRAVPGEPA